MELAIQALFGWDILLQHGALITDSCIEALEAELEHSFDFVTTFVQITRPRNVQALMIPRFMQFAQQFKRVDKPLVDSFFNLNADIESTSEMAALHTSIAFVQTHTVIQILKKKNLEINSYTKIDGSSALHRASKDGHLEIVKIFLNHGASLDLPTSIYGIDTRDTLLGLECVTSFHLAVASDRQDVAEFLEERGADIHKSDKHGLTPLHSAATQSTEIIKYLLQSPRQQRHSRVENTDIAGKIDSTESMRKDDSYGQYGEDKYSDEYSEEFGDSDEGYNDDDDNFYDFPVIKSDSSSQEVHTTYNDISTLLLLANKLNITALHLFFGGPKTDCDPRCKSFYIEIALFLLFAVSMDQLNKTLVRGRRLLQTTLERKDDQLTLALLDMGIDTVSLDEGTSPRTALEMLCIHGSRNNRVIRGIIMNHVDETTPNTDGSTMLHLACIYKQINVLEELLHAGWKINVPNRDEELFLNENGINDWRQEATMSFWGQFLPEISTMKSRDGSPPSSGTTQWISVAVERFWYNSTVFAAYGGKIRNVEVLLSRGADVSKSPSKTALLHLAAARGDEPTVRLLLQYGANIQARDYMGRTPTSVAFDLGNLLDPELELVQGGNFVSAAIEEAIRCRDLGTLKSLLKNGYSLEGSCYCGCSPLLVALTVAGKEISNFLAEAGASLDGVVVCPIPRPTAGFTPLHLAALYGDEQLLEKIIEIGQPNNVMTELLRFGADLDAQDKSGCTPLRLAALCGHSQAYDLLVSAGAISVSSDILLQDEGNLLAYACHFGNSEIIEILIVAGININLTNSEEWPAFFSAMSSQALTEEFQIKLLADVDNLYQTPRSGSLLTMLCSRSLLFATRELLRRVPKDKIYQYVNYIGIYGTALYCTAAKSREQNLKISELFIDHGAELEVIKPSHGTPLIGARTKCNKHDGTQMTAVEEARHHPEIVSLLKNFEEKGFEALNEPRPALLTNMVKVEQCLNRIVEEEEQRKDHEKDEKRNEEEKDGECCKKSGEDEACENNIFEKDNE
ncbi:hypothetical protein BPAE_0075g00290 [Botrytis paeoniae]|uniref:Uncharacterized protein n=1 Tax=Botrytis paeoniae TaxID=278948 RepID=A0A4Z1FLG0_9HELO|nr:hypothetical protein BPAE_0075g00290 [Botrytis paeoniae]